MMKDELLITGEEKYILIKALLLFYDQGNTDFSDAVTKSFDKEQIENLTKNKETALILLERLSQL